MKLFTSGSWCCAKMNWRIEIFENKNFAHYKAVCWTLKVFAKRKINGLVARLNVQIKMTKSSSYFIKLWFFWCVLPVHQQEKWNRKKKNKNDSWREKTTLRIVIELFLSWKSFNHNMASYGWRIKFTSA